MAEIQQLKAAIVSAEAAARDRNLADPEITAPARP
jgi:hypothetical protein